MTSTVELLLADPDLAEAVPAEDRPLAERVGVVPRWELPAGTFDPGTPPKSEHEPVLLVLDGIITAQVILAGRRSARLLGPGDIFDPWLDEEGLTRSRLVWEVTAPATVAVLGDRFLAMTRRWPGLTAAMQERLCRQANRAALLAAISQLPRVEVRIVALLWHLAERWGKMTPEGVCVPLALRHIDLGRLVGARRPTITLALQGLTSEGLVVRRDDGAWLLADRSRQVFESELVTG